MASQSDASEFSDSDHEASQVPVQSSDLPDHAFMDDPELSESEMLSDAELSWSSTEDEDPGRVGNTLWCSCTFCAMMPTAEESTCCMERAEFRGLMEISEVTCIAHCERFDSLVLDSDVLRITLMLIHDTKNKGPLPDPIPNR